MSTYNRRDVCLAPDDTFVEVLADPGVEGPA